MLEVVAGPAGYAYAVMAAAPSPQRGGIAPGDMIAPQTAQRRAGRWWGEAKSLNRPDYQRQVPTGIIAFRRAG